MWQLLKLAWRSIWRSKRRTIITIVSISFSLALAVFFVAFADGIYAKLIDDAVRMQAGHLTVEHVEYRDAPAIDLVVDNIEKLRVEIEKLPGVERTKALVMGQGVAKSGLGAIGVVVMGVEPSMETGSSPFARKLTAGAYLTEGDVNKVVVGSQLARRLKLERKKEARRLLTVLEPLAAFAGLDAEALHQRLKIQLSVGKKMVIASNNVDGEMVEELVRVKGIFETGAVEIDGFFIQLPIDFARKFFGMKPGQATQLGVLVTNPGRRDEVMDRVRAMVGAEQKRKIAVRTWEEVLPDLAAYIKIDGGSNYVFQGILIFLVMFTIFNTILMSVLERRREFAMLLALGTPPGRLKGQIMIETALIGLIGVALGLLIGGLSGYAMQVHGLDLTYLFEEGVSVSGIAFDPVIHALVTPKMLATVGGIVFGATLLLSLYPMGRIKRIPVADVLR